MYKNVIRNKQNSVDVIDNFEYDDKGSTGVIDELKSDIDKQKDEYNKRNGYDKQVALEKINEHNRELDVVEQVEEIAHKKR